MENVGNDIYRFSRNGNNAYLIGETVLIDGIGSEYADEYIADINSITSVRNIKYAVVNHCEPNRCASTLRLLEMNPNITVIASTAGLKFLNALVLKPFTQILAKDGMSLDLCGGTFKFILAPYINWPDSMMTLYGGVLFSCDLFSGDDFKKYFADNLLTHGDYVRLALNKLKTETFGIVFPAEGGEKTPDIVDEYERLIAKSCGAVMIYHSVYGYTYEMAKIVKNTLSEPLVIYNAAECEADTAADAVNACGALIIGTDTINADAPKQIWDIIVRTDKIINKRKPCMLFGSYGWGGEGLYFLENHLRVLKYNIFKKPYGAQLKLRDENDFIRYIKEFDGVIAGK